jgi:DNA adenine methylase
MSEKIFVPPIKIQGIKTKIVPLIKENIVLNASTTWVEPFMGSAVVGLNILPQHAIFADTNPHTIEFYKQIQEGRITSYMVRQFLECEGAKLQELDEEYYYIVRKRFNKFHEPLDFLFLNRSCFNGMIRFNKNYEFNVPYGHKPERFAKAYVTKIVNQVKHIEESVNGRDWRFVCQSFEQTIAEAPSNSFIYCDPPYIGRHVDYYDSWDEESEYLLRDVLLQSGHLFMLSTWDNNEYRTNEYIEKVWGFCHKIKKEHFYHVGAKESNRKPMVEALLTNYEPCGNTNGCLQENEQLTFELQPTAI